MEPEIRLSDIVRELGGELIGDPSLRIERIGALQDATATTIGFIANPSYQSQLASTAAACVIVAPALRDAAAARGATIVAEQPHLYFARLTRWWVRSTRSTPAAGIHPSAVVEEGASIDPSASIGALAFVGTGASIGAHVEIGTHCHVGAFSNVGAFTRFAAQVTFGERCSIGERGIIHGGAVIGADGFGFAPHDGRWEKVEQLGAVRIGNDVEIGAQTCIDRGALDDTVIEDGVKLDNLIQIAHNVRIGAHTIIAACTGIAGSTTIGAHCMIGGAARIAGHLTLAERVQITTCTLVTHSIAKAGVYSGAFPMDENAAWVKNAATLRQLHAMRDRLRSVEERLNALHPAAPPAGDRDPA